MRLIKQCHPSSPDRRKMDILPDEILLRIFTFLPFVMRITLRLVSWRWRKVLFDHSLLQRVKINGRNCEDHQLETLMSAAKRVVEVDFFNCVNLTGSCLMSTELSRLRHLTLTGTAINNPRLTSLLIPFSFVNDDTVMSIVENLSNLRYLCICKTDVTQDCVQRIKSSKANLELCCDA